jgi:hypothetical protein
MAMIMDEDGDVVDGDDGGDVDTVVVPSRI